MLQEKKHLQDTGILNIIRGALEVIGIYNNRVALVIFK